MNTMDDQRFIHPEPSTRAGQTVRVLLHGPDRQPVEFVVEDWWDRVHGSSWMWAQGNPAAIGYALRRAFSTIAETASGTISPPMDDEVLYGHVGRIGYLVHVQEIVPDAVAEGVEMGA